jgi:uncharacterized protein (DUF58 family)
MSAPVERLVNERLLGQVERLSLKLGSLGRDAATGEHRGRGHASSLELSDHRAYAPGDDFRRVDWNAFARLDTLNVKLSDPQQNISLHVLVDRSGSMEFGSPSKARLALQIAACLGYLALGQLDGARFYALDGPDLDRSPRYWGKGQAAEVVRRLQSMRPARATDLDAALAAFLATHPEPGLVVLLTDLLSPTDFQGRLRQLGSAGFDVALLHILCAEELHPSLSGNLEIVDSETGRRRRIGATHEVILDYEQRLERWRTSLADDCRTLGVHYVPLVTDRPIESVMLSDLRRYGLVE